MTQSDEQAPYARNDESTEHEWEPVSRAAGAAVLGLLTLAMGPPAVIAFNAAREEPLQWLHYAALAAAVAGAAIWIPLAAVMAKHVRSLPPRERDKQVPTAVIVALLALLPTSTVLLSIPQTATPTMIAGAVCALASTPFAITMLAKTVWRMMRNPPRPGETPTLKAVPNETRQQRKRRENTVIACGTLPAAACLAAAVGAMLTLVPTNLTLSFAISMTAFATFLVTATTHFVVTPRPASDKRMAISVALTGAHGGAAVGAILGTALTTTF